MNLQSIIITNCMGSMLLVILLISSATVRQRRQGVDKLYTGMIFMTLSACLCEMIGFLIDGKAFPGVRIFAMLTNMWLYISNVTVSYTWTVYTDLKLYGSKERLRRYYIYAGIPAAIALFLLLLNIPLQFIFSFDEQNYYHREAVGYAYYFVTFGYLVASVLVRRGYCRKYGRNEFFPIWMFLIPVFIGATVQAVVYGISVAWSAVALGLAGMYMCMQNELSYIDPLTKLYNRNYMNQKLSDYQKHHQQIGGMMIDIDYFKSINDRFGHSAGDQALVDIAHIMHRALPVNAVLVRFAGDEFVVIQKCSKPEEIAESAAALQAETARFNAEEERPYQLSLSIGTATADLRETGFDGFLNQMDERMYEQKQRTHKRIAEKILN